MSESSLVVKFLMLGLVPIFAPESITVPPVTRSVPLKALLSPVSVRGLDVSKERILLVSAPALNFVATVPEGVAASYVTITFVLPVKSNNPDPSAVGVSAVIAALSIGSIVPVKFLLSWSRVRDHLVLMNPAPLRAH